MVPAGELEAIWGPEITSTPYDQAGAAGSWEMQATALLQDGVLACAWGLADSSRPQLVVLAMDDATEGFTLSESSFLDGQVFPYAPTPLGDRSSAFCRGDSPDAGIQCHWNVLSGSTWLSVFIQGVPEDEVQSDGAVSPDGDMGAIVRTVIDSVSAAPRIPVERLETTLPPCERVVTSDLLSTVLEVDAATVRVQSGRPVDQSMGKSTPTFGQVMWAYSYARLGYSECSFVAGDVKGVAMVAPGAAWILEDPTARQPALVQVDDLGEGIDECVEEQGFVLCTVAVAVGADLILAQIAPQSADDGAYQALALVRAIVEYEVQPR